MAINFQNELGTDIGGILDVDLRLSLVDGRLGLAQAVARRLFQPVGALWYDQDYGAGMLATVGSSVRSFGGLQSVAEAEALKDERVEQAEALISYDSVDGVMDVRLTLTDIRNSTFDLTFQVREFDSTTIVADFSVTDRVFQ